MLSAIFTGTWKPGMHLVETSLAGELGVSRTPVREALSALEGLGMVELRLNHGAVVRPWKPESVREIYDLRALLEVDATRRAAGRLEPAVLSDLLASTRALLTAPRRNESWAEQWFALDSRTHEAIALASGHARLIEEISRYRVLVAAIRHAVGLRNLVREAALEGHVRILSALKKNDAEKAARAMARHIADAGDEAMAILRG